MPCPHAEIRHCPLYAASHGEGGLGCVDDLSAACLVSRHELDYRRGVDRVLAVDPRLVFDCYASETVETGRKDGEAGRALMRGWLERNVELPAARALGGGPASAEVAKGLIGKALEKLKDDTPALKARMAANMAETLARLGVEALAVCDRVELDAALRGINGPAAE